MNDDETRQRRPWRPPLEELAEFLSEHSRASGDLTPGAGDRFVRDFLDEFGAEFVDDLFASGSLEGIGAAYRQKLIDFAIKREIVDEGRGTKPAKLVSPSRDTDAGEQQQRDVS
jgi:hypothetical protein